MCPLILTLEADERFESVVCLTGQHREMLDSVNEFFGVSADYDLRLMKPGQTLTSLTTGILEGMPDILREVKPDIVLVHGDTTTSFAAALAAFYEKLPVGHVEAGLRSLNRYSPYPEEMNRRMTGRIATLHFSPTNEAAENLHRENIREDVFVTGNTAIDALRYTVREGYEFENEQLKRLDPSRRTIVLTAHRRENLDYGIENICRAVRRIAAEHDDVQFVYPVHMNPAVRSRVYPILDGVERVILCEPLGLSDMHNLLARCYMVMTDSGGLQEEAPALDKPVLVLRKETERPEGAEAGTLRLVGVEEEDIYREGERLLSDRDEYERMARARNPYGDGHASERIADAIYDYFKRIIPN